MTKEQFLELSPQDKESFLNSGDNFSDGAKSKVLDSPALVEPLKMPSDEGLRVSPSQMAPIFVHEAMPSGPSPKVGGSAQERDGESDSDSDGKSEQPLSQPKTERLTAGGKKVAYDNGPTDYSQSRANVYQFKDPVELLFFLDEDISSGRVKLHGWQMQFMLDFANGIDNKPSQDDPFQALVRACNGSGKDKFCIAPCAVWLSMCTTMYSSSVVTSSSGVQLDNQTCAYIEQLCDSCNQKIHPKCWKINYRYYECLDTRSPIMCFATDEPGKAEGYHPLKFGSTMGIFESEAKTVPDEIYIAQNKCTGYTHRCIVSTPGLPMGHFFDIDSTAISREELMKRLYKKSPIDYVKYHIQAKDCSHLSVNYVEQMKRDLPGGELGSAYRSQVLAEFGTTTEDVVIPFSHVWTLKRAMAKGEIGWRKETLNTGGLDLSRGGDELVFTVRNGNKMLAQTPFQFDNTEESVEYLVELFYQWNFTNPEALIFVDCGGLGAPIYDRLKGLGWANLRYVVNQGSARDKRIYKNKGAEMWGNLGKLIERKEIILLDDRKLEKQLVGRHWKKVQGDKHQLESKIEAKAKGRPSPDRADAMALCFSNFYPSDYKEPTEKELPFNKPKGYTAVGDFTVKGAVKQKDKNAGLPTTRIDPSAFDELRQEFNTNRNRQITNN